MQQKYWDQGRSTAVDDDTTDFLGAQLLRVRGKPEICVHFPIGEEAHAFGRGVRDEVDVPAWVQSYIRHHAGDVDLLRRSEYGDRNRLPFEIPDRANPGCPEQLEAAGVDTGQECDRISGVDLNHDRRCEVETHIDGARGQ